MEAENPRQAINLMPQTLNEMLSHDQSVLAMPEQYLNYVCIRLKSELENC